MALNVTNPFSNDPLSHSTAIIPNPIVTILNPINAYPQNSSSPSSPFPWSLHRPRFYPIFDPPKIKLRQLAKAKEAEMAQFDDEMCTTWFDDDDLPLSNNIKASAAQFASLCDDDSFHLQHNATNTKCILPRSNT